MATKIDDIDRALIALLREDGRADNRELGQALGISEGTVRARLRRLAHSGSMRVTAVLHLGARGDEFIVMLGVQVEGRPVKEVAADVARLPNVIVASIVSGRYDISATVLVKDKKALAALIADELGAIPGIKTIESSVILDVALSRSEWGAFA